MKKTLLLVLIFSILVTFSFAGGKKEDDPRKFALISKGFQHDFWLTVKLGAETAAKELNVNVSFVGPELESQIDVQIGQVEEALINNVDGIALAALNIEALSPIVSKIKDAGIVFTSFDSDVAPGLSSSFIATDNMRAAAMAAEELANIIGGKGKVLVIVHDPSSTTGIGRRDGFLTKMNEDFPNIEVLNPVYGGGIHEASAELVKQALNDNPDLAGIFASNEGGAVGAGMGLKELGKKIPLVGFDSSEDEINLLNEGYISGFVVQDPFQMGYKTVYILNDLVDGKEVPKRIDTGSTYVSQENLFHANIQKLLYPLGNRQ